MACTADGSASAPVVKKSKFGKDPTVETSFLPDKDREIREQQLREELRKEWEAKQERIKRERLEVTYSYWDGSGHRREIVIPKGTTVGKFLEWVRQDMMDEFPELKAVSAENLLYVKEDLIIPHVRCGVFGVIGVGSAPLPNTRSYPREFQSCQSVVFSNRVVCSTHPSAVRR